jgi:hypothetical protein
MFPQASYEKIEQEIEAEIKRRIEDLKSNKQ